MSSRSGEAPNQYRSRPIVAAAGALIAALLGAIALPAAALDFDTVALDARDAFRRHDRARLATLSAQATAEKNPLAMWIDYWELTNRIGDAQASEFDAFSQRWAGTYVEDRLRNDWLLELGRRRDFAGFAAEYPRFRMNDDREVTCYSFVADGALAAEKKEAALAAWYAQKDADDGCALLGTTLLAANRIGAAEAWKKLRLSTEVSRPRGMRQTASLLGPAVAAAVGEIVDSPARYLTKKASAATRNDAELTAIAIARLATTDTDSAAGLLTRRWERALPPDLAAWTWTCVARQTASKLQPEAADQFLRAAAVAKGHEIERGDDALAWKARSALRADGGRPRWQQLVQAIDAMPAADQKDPTWIYWKAHGLQALAKDSQAAESMRTTGRELLAQIAVQPTFYGQLAAEELGRPFLQPQRPEPLTTAERDATAAQPGLVRAVTLIAIGLRSEGVREWNYSIRGFGDRELLAAAQYACDREVWDRCINTSEKTASAFDVEQRYPMPLQADLVARAKEIGLDPAYVYGLIRQESRFVLDARSGVGASGLMQIMPATAKWTAKKIGIAYTPASINDRDTNLRLGNAYLKLVLDDAAGSQALAAAAYNAGPGRPRKWRDGPVLDAAAWVENIPFPETRDYVKKVLANSTVYASRLGAPGTSLRARLGNTIGPVDPAAPTEKDLP